MNFYRYCGSANGNENGILSKNKAVGVGAISMGCVYLCSLVFHRPLGEKIKSFVFKRRVMNVLIPLAFSVFLLNQNNAWFINHKNFEGKPFNNCKFKQFILDTYVLY